MRGASRVQVPNSPRCSESMVGGHSAGSGKEGQHGAGKDMHCLSVCDLHVLYSADTARRRPSTSPELRKLLFIPPMGSAPYQVPANVLLPLDGVGSRIRSVLLQTALYFTRLVSVEVAHNMQPRMPTCPTFRRGLTTSPRACILWPLVLRPPFSCACSAGLGDNVSSRRNGMITPILESDDMQA